MEQVTPSSNSFEGLQISKGFSLENLALEDQNVLITGNLLNKGVSSLRTHNKSVWLLSIQSPVLKSKLIA